LGLQFIFPSFKGHKVISNFQGTYATEGPGSDMQKIWLFFFNCKQWGGVASIIGNK